MRQTAGARPNSRASNATAEANLKPKRVKIVVAKMDPEEEKRQIEEVSSLVLLAIDSRNKLLQFRKISSDVNLFANM
jgi:hypothetical protein